MSIGDYTDSLPAAAEEGLAAALIGHNGGPPLDPEASWRLFCWKKAVARAWQRPPREIALRRLARAQALGMSYRDYTAVVLDRGIHL